MHSPSRIRCLVYSRRHFVFFVVFLLWMDGNNVEMSKKNTNSLILSWNQLKDKFNSWNLELKSWSDLFHRFDNLLKTSCFIMVENKSLTYQMISNHCLKCPTFTLKLSSVSEPGIELEQYHHNQTHGHSNTYANIQ